MSLPARPNACNFFDIDRDLHFVLGQRQPDQLARWRETLSDFGRWVAGPLDEEAAYTDRHGAPKLVTHGADGCLINHIQYNPLWQATAREIYERGVVGLNYVEDPASYLVTFAMGYLTSQSNVSLHCPVTMTGAVAHVLNRFAPEAVRERYLHQMTRMDGKAHSGGTWATEHHGGSDVGATTTVARTEGDHVRLTGLKWFTSNADGGISVATARPEGAPEGSAGLGLYLVPWTLPDGSLNPMRIRRLKDKLGTCGIATGEVDLTDTYAVEIAGPPEGFKLMMEALEFSRIQNAMAAVGLERRAYLEALCFAAGRSAFGDRILNYPMVQNELVRMRVNLDADLALAMASAQGFDDAWHVDMHEGPSEQRTWLRLATALAKYRTAESANETCRAAIELIGGNGYTYDFVTPRLLRDAQVLTVWEGPANIQALEILRLLDQRYGGAALFQGRVQEIVAEADVPEAAQVTEALKQCGELAARIASDRGQAARHARRLMHLMSDVLSAALLLEQVGQEGSDGRKALILRTFLSQNLNGSQEGPADLTPDWVFDNFDAFIGPDMEAMSAAG